MTTQNQNVADFLLEGKPDGREALLTLQGSHTYGEVRSASAAVAAYLARAGGVKGDRALLASENEFFWVTAYLGILRAGLVCVPLPPTVSIAELSHILQTTEAHFAFVQGGFAVKHAGLLRKVSLVAEKESRDHNGMQATADLPGIRTAFASAEATSIPVNGTDLAALMFTSGSTGQPRGVMVSHGNIRANTCSIIQSLGLNQSDRIMTVLPFHYCFGTSLLHTHLRVGGSLVLDPRFMYPEKILQRMQETQCTGFAGVPSHYQILLRRTSLRTKSFPHLRYVQQAGGSLAPVFLHELREALPTTQIFVMYGQTEATARLSCLPSELLDERFGSIGKGIPGVRLRVENEAGKPVQPGETGEIVAEGENIAQGYWRSPDETAACFRDGRLYTGDHATVDEEGFIFVIGRAKDFLKCGGKRISCKQLEQQLLECEDLLDAAVVGVPDEVLGEAVQAFVVPRTGLAAPAERVRNFCKERWAFQLMPREIVVMGSLPKNSSGKVLKEQLKSRIAGIGAVTADPLRAG